MSVTWNPQIVTPPAIEPLTVDEVRAHCRIDETGSEAAPRVGPIAQLGNVAGNLSAGAYRYAVTFVTSYGGETTISPVSAPVTVANPGAAGKVNLSAIPCGGTAVSGRKLYRTAAGGNSYYLLTALNDNTTTAFLDNVADADLGAEAPNSNTTTDPYLQALITAGRQRVEQDTGLYLITQQVKFTTSLTPWEDRGQGAGFYDIQLPKRPIQTIDAITYTDLNGNANTPWPDDQWEAEGLGTEAQTCRIAPQFAKIWPQIRNGKNIFSVLCTCGFGTTGASVPATLKHAMLFLIAHWYNTRENVIIGTIVADTPMGYRALITNHKSMSY